MGRGGEVGGRGGLTSPPSLAGPPGSPSSSCCRLGGGGGRGEQAAAALGKVLAWRRERGGDEGGGGLLQLRCSSSSPLFGSCSPLPSSTRSGSLRLRAHPTKCAISPSGQARKRVPRGGITFCGLKQLCHTSSLPKEMVDRGGGGGRERKCL